MTVCWFQPHQSATCHCERRFTSEAIQAVSLQRTQMDCHASTKPFEARNGDIYDVANGQVEGVVRSVRSNRYVPICAGVMVLFSVVVCSTPSRQ